jgi:aryl-alcohol dehydrogenase-like predicted oxidoreductase
VDVYYIHAPDRRFPLEELLAGVNTLYEAGKFKRFGLSNYLATEVDEVVRVCREKGYVLPTVYQGNYSAVARRMETELLPTLRKHNIAFNAYSPIAGGFLTKDVEVLISGGEGRWDPNTMIGGLYHALYNKKTMLEGLRLWDKISKESGIAKAELAYRWVAHNSALSGEAGDGVIFGTRTIEQLNQTLAAFAKGPLDPEIAAQIEQVWKIVEVDAPLDNFNDLVGKK